MKFTVVYRSTEGLKTMAARGLVNGRGPLRRSGRDLVSEYAVQLLLLLMLLSVSSRQTDVIKQCGEGAEGSDDISISGPFEGIDGHRAGLSVSYAGLGEP